MPNPPPEPAAEPLDISVVIPAYNRQHIVGRAVLSALSQRSRPAAEVIVVDDGSADDTAAVAEKLGARVIRQENQGEGPARNTGIEAATATWVAFLDSDDEWLPNHLDVLSQHIEGHTLVASASRCVPSGRRAGIGGDASREIGAADLLWPQSPLVPSSTMVRRDVAIEVGGFRSLPTAADLDFFIRVLEHGPGVILPDITAIYFEHAAQISTDNRGLKTGRIDVLREYSDRPWFPEQVLRDVEVSDTWDMLRTAQRGKDWNAAALHARALAKPSAVRALTDVWRYRRVTRRQ